MASFQQFQHTQFKSSNNQAMRDRLFDELEDYSIKLGKLLDSSDENPEGYGRLRWIRARSPRIQKSLRIHDENMEERLPGSGQWFLDSTEYRDWVSTPGSTLFAPGIPGSGKSTMTSIVLNDLRQSLEPGARLGWFWFAPGQWGEGEDRHALHAVIADLALLLCSEYTDAGNRLPPSVVQLLKDMMEPRLRTATMADLSHILKTLGAPTNRVFLLFDAVEAATEDVRGSLMPQLQDLQESLGLNIFVTALLGTGIDELFPRSTSLEIRASAEDVSKYMRRGVESDLRLRRLIHGAEHDDLRHEIIQATVEMSDGMSVKPLSFKISNTLDAIASLGLG